MTDLKEEILSLKELFEELHIPISLIETLSLDSCSGLDLPKDARSLALSSNPDLPLNYQRVLVLAALFYSVHYREVMLSERIALLLLEDFKRKLKEELQEQEGHKISVLLFAVQELVKATLWDKREGYSARIKEEHEKVKNALGEKLYIKTVPLRESIESSEKALFDAIYIALDN